MVIALITHAEERLNINLTVVIPDIIRTVIPVYMLVLDTMNVVEIGNIVRDILVLLILLCVLNIVRMTTSHILATVNLFAMMHGVYIVTVIAPKNVKKTVVVVEEAVAVVVAMIAQHVLI